MGSESSHALVLGQETSYKSLERNMESYSKGRLNNEESSNKTKDSIPVLVGGRGLSYSESSSFTAPPFFGGAFASFLGGG